MASDSAPILSTPAEHILEDPSPLAVPTPDSRLSEEQLYIQYEIKRTIDEIRAGRWRRVGLQFPDEMLVDATRVFEKLRDGLRQGLISQSQSQVDPTTSISNTLQKTTLTGGSEEVNASADIAGEHRICILGDTSYGACCVDEIAAEHVDADVVVHYGRACLSPTGRLPVIYVFTAKPMDLDASTSSFKKTYADKDEKVCLMADLPFTHHLQSLHERLLGCGYTNIFTTEIIHDPKSLIPNRTLPEDVSRDANNLQNYSIFHVSTPPTSLLLILSTRVRRIHIFPTEISPAPTLESSTAQLLRRRYALVTRLSSVPIFGILINTLSVTNYMSALQHCQDLITRAGKKYYVFVVGKVNAAKIANFAEIGGWVVIGCWESSLIESKDFYRPIITPFELDVALQDDSERTWGAEWIGDFSQLLEQSQDTSAAKASSGVNGNSHTNGNIEASWDEQTSDDEPPEFDLRTGRYVSHSRPIGRQNPSSSLAASSTSGDSIHPSSSALVQRAAGDMATINGTVSPAAEFLRSQRTWQGLGSDHEIAYERDEEGKIRGAVMEEGRSGIARGYTVGQEEERS